MDISTVFEALASTPRRKVLAYLSSSSMTAGEIAERFEMSKPALSKHLKILENAKLIVSERKGQFIHYSLADPNMMLTISNMLATFCPVAGPLKRESAAKARAEAAALANSGADGAVLPNPRTEGGALPNPRVKAAAAADTGAGGVQEDETPLPPQGSKPPPQQG